MLVLSRRTLATHVSAPPTSSSSSLTIMICDDHHQHHHCSKQLHRHYPHCNRHHQVMIMGMIWLEAIVDSHHHHHHHHLHSLGATAMRLHGVVWVQQDDDRSSFRETISKRNSAEAPALHPHHRTWHSVKWKINAKTLHRDKKLQLRTHVGVF